MGLGLAAAWICLLASPLFAQRAAAPVVINVGFGAAPIAGAAAAAELRLPQPVGIARTLAGAYLPADEEYVAWVAHLARKRDGARESGLAAATGQGLAIARAVLYRARPDFESGGYAELLHEVEPPHRALALTAGIIVGEYDAKLPRYLETPKASFADADFLEVDPERFLSARIGKGDFTADQVAARQVGAEEAYLPDLWNVLRVIPASLRRRFVANRARYEAWQLREQWGTYPGRLEAPFDRLLTARGLEANGPASYVNSGEFGVVFRLPTTKGAVAVKVLRRLAFDVHEFRSESAGQEPALIRQIANRFANPALAKGRPRPDNVDVLSLVAAGSLDLRQLGLAAGPKAVFAPVVVLPWAEGETLESFLDRKGQISRRDWKGFEAAVARLHALGYGHDDLRSRNIQIRQDRATGRSYFTILDTGSIQTRADGLIRYHEALDSDRRDLRQISEQLEERGLLVP